MSAKKWIFFIYLYFWMLFTETYMFYLMRIPLTATCDVFMQIPRHIYS